MPHIHYLYDYTISAFIVSESKKVLLVSHPRYNKWLPIGGHIELDEDPEEALYREIKEEAGLEVEVLSSRPDIQSPGNKFIVTPNYVAVHEANPPHKHISFTYFAKALDDTFTLSDEHDDMRWFTAEELHDEQYALSQEVIFFCTEALKLVMAGAN